MTICTGCHAKYGSSGMLTRFPKGPFSGSAEGDRTIGFGKRGLLEKGSFQKSPFSRDSRELRDSRASREPPNCGKERRFRPFSRDPRESRDFRDSRDFSIEKTPFVMTPFSGPETKATERAQNADFRRKPPIFADSPLLLEIQAFGGHRKPQKTADFCRKPKIFAENRRKPQIGLRHLRCVTFSSALPSVLKTLWRRKS